MSYSDVMASDLITITEYAASTGRDLRQLTDVDTNRIEANITAASIMIRNYLDRDLTLAADAVAGPRVFRYYGHGSLDTDDFTAINSVSLVPNAWSGATRTLQPFEYLAMSSLSSLPVMDTIEIWTMLPFGESPAMGFQWNADTYGYRPNPLLITVDAVWGWPSFPPDIKQAAVWTVGELMTPATPYVQESIAGYSRTLQRTPRGGGGNDGGGPVNPASLENAIPGRAQAILSPYIRVNV